MRKQLFIMMLSLLIIGCAKEELQEKEVPYQSISSADISVMADSDLKSNSSTNYFHLGQVIDVHFGAEVVDRALHLEVLSTITREVGIEFNIIESRLKHITIKINYNEDPSLETIDYVVTNNAEIDVVFHPFTNATFLGHEHRPSFNDYLFVTEGNSVEVLARLYAYKLGQESAVTQPIDFEYLRSIYTPAKDVAFKVNTWANGVIPFGFTDNMPQAQRGIILDAMATYESFLNIDYVEYSIAELVTLQHGLLIKYTGAVQSSVYPTGMPEYISDFRVGDIQYFDMSVALHELGHNLGRPHEQQLANALEHLIIDYDNIAEGWEGNFKVGETIFNTPFDYHSNMIYGSYDASKDQGKPVMTDLEGNTFEPSKTLTELDKQKYIELYSKKN